VPGAAWFAQGGRPSPPHDRSSARGPGGGGAQRPCPPASTPLDRGGDRRPTAKRAAAATARSVLAPAPGRILPFDSRQSRRWGRSTSETSGRTCAVASWPQPRILVLGGGPDRLVNWPRPWPSFFAPASPCCNGAIACSGARHAEVVCLVRCCLEADGVAGAQQTPACRRLRTAKPS